MSQPPTAIAAAATPRSRRALWIGAALIVAVSGVAVMIYAVDDSGSVPVPASDSLWYEIRKGPLTISLSANGSIKSKDQLTIRNELPGKTTIVKLVPEGTVVKKGDLVFELDSNQIKKDLVNQQIQVNKSNADLTKSTENLAVVKNQAESDLVKAQVELNDARINLTKYQEGEYNRDYKKAEAALKLADSAARQAKDKAEWSQRLLKEGFISSNEYEADKLAYDKTTSELTTAQLELDLLQKYTREQKTQELKGKVRQTELAVERAQRKGRADVVQAEADLRAKTIENERELSKLETLQKQLEKTSMFAPADGMIIHNNSRWQPDRRLAEGAEVFERQEMMYLPTSTSIMASIQIPEISISKVKLGMSARVTIEAIPGRVLSGKVGRVGQFPDREEDWLNRDLKVYTVEIHIDGENPDLRPGMSCQGEIMIQQLPEAVFVPVQSVVLIDKQPVVYARAGDGPRRLNVTIGLDNNRMVHILQGLGHGDQVMLSPPLEAGAINPARQ